ncbi:MAG: NAD-binding protein, partial [Bacteroidales bacterium]|nr:NAD-binding protein [Bacteroidales bacterium]
DLAGGFLMASRLGLVIAAAFVGMELGVITPGMNTVLIIMAIITCVLSPLLYNIIFKQKAISDEKTVIVGGSSIGVLLSRRLQMHGRSSVIIERNRERYEEIKAKGLDAFYGDGTNVKVYERIGLKKENFILVFTGQGPVDEAICQMLRNELFHERIISKPENLKEEIALRNLGVDVIDSRLVIAATLENMILKPTAHHALIDSFENYIVEDLEVISPEVDGRQIKEIHLHKDGMLMLLTRGHEKQVPHGDTYLRKGDRLTVFGTATAIDQIRQKMSGK